MAEIVTLPGVKGQFAVGLSWRHEDNLPGRGALRARSTLKGRWAVIRTTSAGSVQAGFCDFPAGAHGRRGIRALAAVVADFWPQPWMGVYRLAENRYWYIAVRDAQEVVPDGDQVGTLEEIARLQARHLTYGDWTRIEGSVDDLCEMALAVPAPSVLRDMGGRRGARAAMFTVSASVVAIIIALWAWQRHEHTLDLQQQALIARRPARVAGTTLQDEAPWSHEPVPSAVFGNCGKAWQIQPLASAGWTLTRWRCEVQAHRLLLTTSWNRSGGLANAAPGVLSPDAQHASGASLMEVAFQATPATLLPADEARRAVWTLAQTYGLKLEPRTPATVAVLPGAMPARVPRGERWSKAAYRLTLDSPPWPGLGEAFDAITGLRVNAVDLDLPRLQWTVSATGYGQQESSGEADRPAVGAGHAPVGVGGPSVNRGQP